MFARHQHVDTTVNLFTNPGFEAPGDTYEARRNLQPNPLAQATTPLTVALSVSIARIAEGDGWVTRVVATGAGSVAARTAVGRSGIPVTPGETYTSSLSAKHNGTPRSISCRLVWYDTAGAQIAQTSATSFVSTATYQRLTSTQIAPTNAAYAQQVFFIAGAVAGDSFDVTALLFERGAGGPFFHGGMSPDRSLVPSWAGAEYISESILTGTRVARVSRGRRSPEWAASGSWSLKVDDGDTSAVDVAGPVVVTARHAGQTATLSGTTVTATAAGQALRLTGTGTLRLGPGWWDQLGDGVTEWFSGASPTSETTSYHWGGSPNASISVRFTLTDKEGDLPVVSTLIPPLDLVPSVSSRILIVRAVDFTEGEPAQGEITIELPWDVDVKADGVIIKAGSRTLKFDAAGEMRIRLPASDTTTNPSQWFIVVKKSWAPHPYRIRIPIGTTPINLVDCPIVEELPANAPPGFLLTGASATVGIGGPSVDVSTDAGIANFRFLLPAGIWSKPAPAGADFDTYYTAEHSGHFYFSAGGAAGMKGLPPGFGNRPGSILVLGAPGRTATQFYFPYGFYSTTMLVRYVKDISTNLWTDWGPIGGTPDPVTPFTRGTIPAESDLNSWYLPDRAGSWHCTAATAPNIIGLPPQHAGQPGQVFVIASSSRVSSQIFLPYGFYSTSPLIRSIKDIGTNAWTDWVPMGGSGGGGQYDPTVEHSIRQAQFVNAMGPVGTGGKGAVAIRCDHGFAAFKATVLPALQARGIKPAQAYNPRNWHYAENAGVTATDLNAWVASGVVEVMNHSANHLAAESEDALRDQIVTGLAEIEAQLPAAAGKVWGFAPPGVSSGNWMGFDDGRTPAGWATFAGRLILGNHAVGTGYLPGTSSRVLDGTPRDGLGHITMDSQSVAQLKAAIDQAATRRTGLQFMVHPSQLDQPGKLTTTQFVEVLDYIVAKRTAGDLVTLSPYQMLVADTSRPA